MEIPRHWRLKKQRYSLIGEICPKKHKIFPPRNVCPDCLVDEKTLPEQKIERESILIELPMHVAEPVLS